MADTLICAKCVKNADCGLRCEAWTKLYEIYMEAWNKERHQLIKKYGRMLGIVDAEPSKEMRKLAEVIIERFPDELSVIRDYGVKIGYVLSQERPPEKGGKTKYADCRKLKWTYKAWLPFDFVITFYEPNVEVLSENQRKILMLHELKHIGIGEKGLRLEEHDIEDFENILQRYGIKWGRFGEEVPDILSEDNIILNEVE